MKIKEELQQQYLQLKQEINNIETLIQEQLKEKETNETLLNDVDAINQLKENSELIVPISKGIFIKLKVKEFNGFVVNVGNNVLVDKDINGIKKLLSDNIKIIEENLKVLRDQEAKLLDLLNQIAQKLRED